MRVCVSTTLLLAFALRIFRLDGQSFWHDEGLSVAAARPPVVQLVDAALGADQPPGYLLALHFWLRLAGESDYAVRFLSVALGMVGLALLWCLAARLAGRLPAALAVGLVTPSPFHLYYSQEARNYALLAALALLATYSYVRASLSGGRWWGTYYCAAIATVATHHAASLVLAIHALHLLSRGRAIPRVGLLVMALLWFPWAIWTALNRLRGDAMGALVGPGDLGAQALSTWIAFALGDTLDRIGASSAQAPVRWPPLVAALAIPLWVAALAGAVSAWRRGHFQRLLLGLIALPPLAAILISLVTRPYVPRYVTPSALLFMLLLALGIATLYRRWPLVGGLCLAWATLANLTYSGLYLLDPAFGRDDHRGAARFINGEAAEREAVLLVSGYFQPVFERYLDPRLPLFGLPSLYPVEESEIVSRLEGLAQGYDRLWMVSWQEDAWDPHHVVRNWLDTRGFLVGVELFRGVEVRGYLSHRPVTSGLPPGATPVGAQMGDVARLLGYEVTAKPTPGRLRLTLYWEPLRSLAGSDFTVFAHVISRSYYTWAQKDNRPAYDRFPTDRWQPGMVIADGYDLELLEGTPSGSYRLEVGMYDTGSGDRLLDPQSGRAHILLGPVQLTGAPAPSYAGRRPVARLAELELLDAPWTGDLRPGGEIQLTTIWRTAEEPRQSYLFALSLRGKAGEVTRNIASPDDVENAASPWKPGRVVRVQQRLPIAATALPGTYRLELALDAPNPSENATSWLGPAAVVDLGAVVVR